jgi:hypothetical protein
MSDNYILEFIRKYRPTPPGTEEYRQWVEDVRKLVVTCKINFREDQANERFVDGTGDVYIEQLKETLK